MGNANSSVLDVGNCDPDHGMIRKMLLKHFDVEIDRVMFVDEAIEKLRKRSYDLVMFNRLIFDDGSEGIELLRRAKVEPSLAATPMMMISNFAEAQARAVAAGGVPGFGKDSIFAESTCELLSRYLNPRKSGAAV
ncbi:MAG: response regulator [Phycisphaerae bacterium]|nr:response regulator [Phycisphaerae bacterium]